MVYKGLFYVQSSVVYKGLSYVDRPMVYKGPSYVYTLLQLIAGTYSCSSHLHKMDP